ncbi:MAG: hypothetical protein H6736_01080 [Alphaproteobacteria bacterium]|nr:hypothetical protein [Alphaproteobacteria bacterium]
MYRLVPPALLVAVLAASAWAEHPPGEVIGSVVAVDVTQAGLDAFLPIIDDYVPAGYELAEVASATTFPASNDCAFFDACYEYDVSNLSAEFELVNPTITPGNGVINVATTINLSANSSSDPLLAYVRGEAANISYSTTCHIWLDPIDIPVNASIQLDYNTFTGNVTANILPIQYDISALNSNNIQVTNCPVGTINTITSLFGFDIIDFAIGQVTPILDDQISTLVTDLNNTSSRCCRTP